GKDIYPQMVVDPNVELTTGEKRGDAYHIHYWTGLQSPLCIANAYGKGQAILLNFSVHNAPAEQFIGDLLAACGVTPVVKVTGPNGRPVRDVEVTRWANGDVELLALLGTHGGPVVVTLAGARHAYDLKQRRSLGAVDQFTVELQAHRASIFAFRPQEVRAPRLMLSQASVKRGNETAVEVRTEDAGYRDAVRIHLVDPDGQAVPWFQQIVIADDDAVTVPLAFALNDAPGDWKLRASSLLGGGVHEETVRLE
ncbi:MAG: hypothetical protein KJ060_13935, partial [Candidatus Hydrogenedentes bacterium]|nr:hypothetical protein [Candidatus Hydrogenedentota bacterium]